MYSFAQRSDMDVIDEPFYAYHLKHHNIDHPGKQETLAVLPAGPDEVFEQIDQESFKAKHLFLKNMPHHVDGIDPVRFLGFKHLFLIRDPARMIVSFTKVVKDVRAKDFALEDQWRWFSLLRAQGHQPTVIHSETILQNPERALEHVCQRLEIPFESNMLSWPAGPKEADGPWAPHWYGNVHRSTGFGPPAQGTVDLPESYRPLLEEIQPFYERLRAEAINL